MNDDERDIIGLSEGEALLSQRLAGLGPLMRAQERAEGEIDPAFAADLRAHLVQGRPLRPRGTSPVIRALHQPMVRAVAAAAAAAVLTIVLIVSLLQPPAFKAPYPTTADLIFSFPAPSVTIRHLSPLVSLIHPIPGQAYRGRLSLQAGRLPTSPGQLRAYRLAAPSNVVGLARVLLGIRSPARRVAIGRAVWAVAADGGSGSNRPLHSIAVSLATGELIYHDQRNGRLRYAAHALGRDEAAALARRWLERLGWPGKRMPLRSARLVPGMPRVRQVVLGWPGVGPAATEDATLWVTPDRSVIEVWAWPPVVQSGLIPARPLSVVWPEVRGEKLPLAVEGVSPRLDAPGSGRLQRTTVVVVLVPAGRGVYLVPAYRFEGKVRLRGRARERVWYSLAPTETR